LADGWVDAGERSLPRLRGTSVNRKAKPVKYMLCRNKVADFAQWKQVFDSHAEAQRQSGLYLQRLWRGLDDPNEVFMLFEVTDIDEARNFVTSPKVPDAQQQSGVLQKPDIYFME
jgi:hypothetical protein